MDTSRQTGSAATQPSAPAPDADAAARRMSVAARRHVLPFAIWMVLLLLVQQLHLTDVADAHEGNLTPGLGLLSMGGAYAWRVLLGLGALLIFAPWRCGYSMPSRRNVLTALVVGAGVFLLWIGLETEFVKGLCPGLAELYEKWCVLPFGKLRDPSVYVRLEAVSEDPLVHGLAGQFFPVAEGVPIPEGYAAAAGTAIGNFYAPSVCGWGYTLLRLAGSAFVISVIEEFFWRGFLYRWIQKIDFLDVDPGKLAWPAFLGTAALFGAEHTEWLAGIVCGLVYGWMYVRTRDIWSVCIAHATTNLLLGVYVLATGAYQFW